MKRLDRKGYTLIELIVVVLIVGILASFGIPQYLRTVETSKADDAVSTINMIGTTNRMFALDHGGAFAYGNFTVACGNTTSCPTAAPYSNPCALVWCKYLSDQDWASRPYSFSACNAAATCSTSVGNVTGTSLVSAARRKSTTSPYSTWRYGMETTGSIAGWGTNVPAPSY